MHDPDRLPECLQRPRRATKARLCAVLLAASCAVTGCNGFDLGINPGPDVRKEQGPLVKPPPGVLAGTAM